MTERRSADTPPTDTPPPDSSPTEPSRTEPSPTEPSPTEPSPTEPSHTDSPNGDSPDGEAAPSDGPAADAGPFLDAAFPGRRAAMGRLDRWNAARLRAARRRGYPVPGSPNDPFEPRHASLEEDETLLPEVWTVQVRRVRATARQDLRKLLDMTREERRERVEDAESRRSFRSHALAELLLEESRTLAATDPMEADDLAHVAWRVLHWVAGPPGELWRQTAQARALAHRANALRCAGELVAADRMFQRFRTRVVHERLEDLRLVGEAAQWEAALHWRRERWDSAVDLLGQAVEAHRGRGDRLSMAHALEHWADVLRGAGHPARAADCLAWAARVLEPAALGEERLRVLLHRGQALCDAGRWAKAAACLEEVREVRTARQPAAEGEDPRAVDVAWLEGRLAAGGAAPDPQEAQRNLREARNALLAAGRPGDAALAALDLVGLDGRGEPAVATGEAEASGGEGPAAALAARERAARWITGRLLEAGVPVAPPLAAELRCVATRLRDRAPSAEELAAMRRRLLREAALAAWGA